jgi:hypothetical protein
MVKNGCIKVKLSLEVVPLYSVFATDGPPESWFGPPYAVALEAEVSPKDASVLNPGAEDNIECACEPLPLACVINVVAFVVVLFLFKPATLLDSAFE